MDNEIALYIHLPFCIRKCLYCDFLSFDDFSHVQEYKTALINEILNFSTNKRVKSIFFGGGTPTAISHIVIAEIMQTIKNNYNINADAEITVEANPGTLTDEKAEGLLGCGINRISLGLQAWQNPLLKTLGRIHTQEEFLQSYSYARRFKNVNVDIMFALPNQTMNDWKETLDKVTQLEPEHISAYSLIIEEGTPFYNMYQTPLCSDELDREMYYYCRNFLAEKGYIQYEISNFAKKGFHSRHNMTYWQRGEYKGFGLGAASLLDNRRLKNTDCMADYLQGVTVTEDETLTVEDCISEFMFLGLRCTNGISVIEFEKCFGKNIYDVYGTQIEKMINDGLLEAFGDNLRLTEVGVDLSNRVFAEFLF